MAAPPNPSGCSPEDELGGDTGGAVGGGDPSIGGTRGFPSLVDEGNCCGSSNPAASLFRSPEMFPSPEKRAATAVAQTWEENPFSSEHVHELDESLVFPSQDWPSTVEDCLMTQQSNISQREKGKKVQQHIESDSDECHETFEETSKREDCWSKTDTPDIDPPVFKMSVGRAQTKRRKGQFEVPQLKSTSRMGSITCSNCGRLGHRYTSCYQPLKPALHLRKNKHMEQRTDGHESTAPTTAQAPSTDGAAPRPPSAAAARKSMAATVHRAVAPRPATAEVHRDASPRPATAPILTR